MANQPTHPEKPFSTEARRRVMARGTAVVVVILVLIAIVAGVATWIGTRNQVARKPTKRSSMSLSNTAVKHPRSRDPAKPDHLAANIAPQAAAGRSIGQGDQGEAWKIPGLADKVVDRSVAELAARVDPAEDDWPVEVFNELAGRQLARLADTITGQGGSLDELADGEFACTVLRPRKLQIAFRDEILQVLRPDIRSTEADLELTYKGASGWDRALEELLQPLADSDDLTAHVKLYRVNLEGANPITNVAIHVHGEIAGNTVEQHAEWICEWTSRGENDVPRLLEIRLSDYEETATIGQSKSLFQDCTASVFRDSDVFRDQLIHGIDHWRRVLEASLDPDLSGHQGLAIADFNGDGYEDLYVCQQGGLPNRLFFQQPDGRLKVAPTQAGVDQLELTASALGLDLDNDGDQDLAIGTVSHLIVFENDGSGTFRQRASLDARASVQSMAAADYDLDGHLDLYVCGYSPGTSIWKSEKGLGAPVPYYDANNGGPNQLFRNQGNFQFTDVTSQVGLDQNNRRFTFAASWEDYDNDGDSDLYVANDFGRNNLYRNDAGHFRDVAAEAGVEDMATGMSVSWSDYNNDGWMDVYVGNMFSSAGNRIAYQRQFLPGAQRHVQRMARGTARGNSLFQNSGSGSFVDVSESSRTTRGRWAWSSNFVDVNNDAYDDIVVANGFITHPSTDDL